MSTSVANSPRDRVALSPDPGAGVIKRLALYGAGAACLSVIFSASGAYDTDHLEIAHRLCLWLTVSALIIAQAALINEILKRLTRAWRISRLGAALGAVPVTVLLMALELHALKFTPLLPKEPDPPIEFALFVTPPVAAIAGFVVLLSLFTSARQPIPVDHERHLKTPRRIASQSTASPSLPPHLPTIPAFEVWPKEPILTIKANDHYLEVATGSRRLFIRGRMKDALSVLGDSKGLQVHRSWWVSLHAIEHVKRNGRDHSILLKSGERIPVGRSRVSAMRERGLLR